MDFLSLVENLKKPQFLAPCVLPQGIHIFASHSKKGQKLDWCPLTLDFGGLLNNLSIHRELTHSPRPGDALGVAQHVSLDLVLYSLDVVLFSPWMWHCVVPGRGVVYSLDVVLCIHWTWCCVVTGHGVV